MRLYKVTHVPMDVPLRKRWVGTQAEAASTRAEWQKKHAAKRDEITTEEVDVPTTKKELLEWLNANQA